MADKEMLEKLREVKQTATEDLSRDESNKNAVVQNVNYYGIVELERIDRSGNDSFELYTVEIYDYEEDELKSKIYLDGKEVDMGEILREYKDLNPIKDTIDKAKENQEKSEKDGKGEQVKPQSLNDLEQEEKVEEDEEKTIETEKEETKKQKPKYTIQSTIDVDQAYVDNWTTLRRGFDLPSGVEKLAIAYPNSKDENVLSSHLTIYMLDANGYIVENVNGKTVKDIFEIDSATGNNPMYDDNTKLELEEYSEKNKGQTIGRFKSKKNPDLYLSVEQTRVGDYAELYAGRKTMNGNDPVEVQLETNNTDIQTSLEMQEIISGYKGIYNKENIDKEADAHEAHGDDIKKIAKANSDGNINTIEICDEDIIPGTDTTWKEFANMCGFRGSNAIKKAQKEFIKYKEDYPEKDNEEIIEDIQEEIENEMPGPNRDRR